MDDKVTPKLLAVSGPLKNSSFVLPDGEMPIGRDATNLLAISDPSLSRRHCILISNATGYSIRDLESRNGTLINGVAVKEARVNHGDRISVGDSVFVLLLEDAAEDLDSSRVEFNENPAHATVQIRPQDVIYLQSDRVQQALPKSSRMASNLNALLKISRVVHSIRGLDELARQILKLIFEVIPAERGAVLLDRHSGEKFNSVFAAHRSGNSRQPIQVSRTIIGQVIERSVAVLATDIGETGPLSQVESLANSRVRSVLCVPLIIHDKLNGCIYLDSSNAAASFDEDDLQLVSAIGGTCAVALQNAARLQWLEDENQRLASEINLAHNLVGESARMKDIYRLLARLAATESTVLLRGESGTGKELAARAIHRNSARSEKPFVAINCAAIPEALLESELFGHERGSFTGAFATKKGRFEVANGGVVFLDEIGELAPALQVKLLRVLQERQFERVGATRSISVDIRVIAATNRNLEEALKSNEFREDLYYRLNVISVVMPPLRERREDIPVLASYFLAKYVTRGDAKPKRISPEAMEYLVGYDWPGNVRELENAMERALVLSASEAIRPEDLPEAVLDKALASDGGGARYHKKLREVKKQLILDALKECDGNYTEAAQILGVHANYLHRLIRNLNLKQAIRSSSGPRKS
jgi:transcriptional regulator with GAF, ATPase, and Fis domain